MRWPVLFVGLFGVPVCAAVVGPPAGQPVLNQSSAQNAQFNVGTGTVRGPFTARSLTASSVTITGVGIRFADGTVQVTSATAGGGSGGGGGASSLEVLVNGVRVSSPTATVSFGPAFTGSLVLPSTAAIDLDPSSVTLHGDNVILLQDTLQDGATFYISSGTVTNTLDVSTLRFQDATIQDRQNVFQIQLSSVTGLPPNQSLAKFNYPDEDNHGIDFYQEGIRSTPGYIGIFTNAGHRVRFKANPGPLGAGWSAGYDFIMPSFQGSAGQAMTIAAVTASTGVVDNSMVMAFSDVILSTDTLQAGSTFYVSSGTVQNTLDVSTLRLQDASIQDRQTVLQIQVSSVTGAYPIASMAKFHYDSPTSHGLEINATASFPGYVKWTAPDSKFAFITSSQAMTNSYKMVLPPGIGSAGQAVTVADVFDSTANLKFSYGLGTTGQAVQISSNAILGGATAYSDGIIRAANLTGSADGTNTGDQTIVLTGDVTGTGTSSFATAAASVQPNVRTFSSSITVTGAGGLLSSYGIVGGSLTASNLSSGQCVQTGAGGLLSTTGDSCKTGTITAVTAGYGIAGGGASGAVTVNLAPDSTSYIQNRNTLQSGTTAYPSYLYVGSTATITGQLSVPSIRWPDGTVQVSSPPAGGGAVHGSLKYALDAGGVALSSASFSVKRAFVIDNAITISSWTLLSDSGTVAVSVSSSTYTNYLNNAAASSICASACPTLTTARASQSVNLSGWTTTLNIGDVLVFDLANPAPSTLTWMVLQVFY